MGSVDLVSPPVHSKPRWTSSEWFSDRLMEYVKPYFHHVSKYIGVHVSEFYELHIVVDGYGHFYSGGQFFEVSQGSVLIVAPGTHHGCVTESTMNVFHALIKCDFFKQYDYELRCIPGYTTLFEIEPYLRSEGDEPLCMRLYKENYHEIASHLGNLVRLDQSEYAGREVLKTTLLLHLIGLLSSYASHTQAYRRRSVSDYASMDIVRSMEYIRMNVHKKLSIDDLAARANMSRSTYLRHFKRVSGRSPISFLTLCRVTYSKKLLCYTKKSVSAIAQECGFFDSSHFIRTFASSEGVSPSGFRDLYSSSPDYSACTLCAPQSDKGHDAAKTHAAATP